MVDTSRVVDALRSLVVFGPDQAGAYRELFGPVAEQLGADVPTKLHQWLEAWGVGTGVGVVVLTGNAGTGKTAATEHFCTVIGGSLPTTDELVAVADAMVAKDASGIHSRELRAEMFRAAFHEGTRRKVLLCVNEGILRDAAEDLALEIPNLIASLHRALHDGATASDGLTIVNLNRQRLTESDLWESLVEFVSREELWVGCVDCPSTGGGDGCPMRTNAAALRRSDTRQVLRLIIQTCSGGMVPTMRELLAVLAYAICGDGSGDSGESGLWNCARVKERHRDRGREAFTASSAFYNLFFGAGLDSDTRERSPLLGAIGRLGAGVSSDLEVDEWLRDTGRADASVRDLSGATTTTDDGPLAGSRSHLDRVRTEDGELTFNRLGETVAISENTAKVAACMRALVAGAPPAQWSWRRRMLLEGSLSLGGPAAAVSRLTAMSYASDLVALARRIADGADTMADLKVIVRGLNFLVTGHADSSEGLIVPDPASLFARNPGAFRPARPAFVHAKVPVADVLLAVPDVGLVAEVLDVDHVEVELSLRNDHTLRLRVGPLLYQAIREAEMFRGPVGQGTAEMTDLRSFYGRLASADQLERELGMLVADPAKGALVRIQLPHFASHE